MNKLILILTMGFLSTLLGCGQNKVKTATGDNSIPVENITATKDQLNRRARSEEYCTQNNIPVYKSPNALFVAPEDSVIIRTQDAVVDRTLALCYIGLKSEGLEQKHLDQFNKDFGIDPKLTPVEKEFISAQQPTEQQKIDANWRYESLHVMLWALGFIDSLSYPSTMCNVGDDVKFIFGLKEQQFRLKAKLRTKKEILDQADLSLRLNWACVNARVNDEPAPGHLDKSVVFERHHSLNWLIRYLGQNWDDVTTDT